MGAPHSIPASPRDNSWNSTYICIGRTYTCVAGQFTDSDIVGIGTLVAFLLPTFVLIIAVVGGYLSNSLPGVQLTWLDRRIIFWTRKLLRLRNEENEDRAKRAARQEFIRVVVLSVSDQQLITGLGFLLASFLKCDLSLYSFIVSTSVSWFACVVHLSTLSLLYHYMRQHKILLYLRLTGMAIIAGLLFTALTMIVLSNSEVTYATYCVFALGDISQSVGDVFAQVAECLGLFVWLTRSYVSRTSALLSPQDTERYGSWICAMIVTRKHPNKASKVETLVEEVRNRSIRPNPPIKVEKHDRVRKFRYWLCLWRYYYIEMTNSFIWQIIAMFFGVAIGVTLVILSRGTVADPHDENLTRLGFGQILAVATLLLPILGFVTAYCEYRKAIHPEEEAGHAKFDYIRATRNSITSSVQGPKGQDADELSSWRSVSELQCPDSAYQAPRERLLSDSSLIITQSRPRSFNSIRSSETLIMSNSEIKSGPPCNNAQASDLKPLVWTTSIYAMVFIPFGAFCAMFAAFNFEFPPYFNFLTLLAGILLIPQLWLFVSQARDVIMIIW